MSQFLRGSVSLPGRLERLVDDVFDQLIHGPWRGATPPISWEPAIDVREGPEELIVLIDVPGVVLDEVQVVAANQVLIVRGKRASLDQFESGTLIYTERHRGEFVRRIPLPRAVEPSRLTMSLDKGLLLVRIPKSPVVKCQTPPTDNES